MDSKEVLFLFALIFGYLLWKLIQFDKNILIFLHNEVTNYVERKPQAPTSLELVLYFAGVAAALFMTLITAAITMTAIQGLFI